MEIERLRERTWAEVDLDALVHNFKQLKSLVEPRTKIMVAVKADAYGHGSMACAKALTEAGADYLAVATANEALELRRAGLKTPILILGMVSPCEAEVLVEQDIKTAVCSYELAAALSQAAVKLGRTAGVHIKVNTGMERLGFSPDCWEEILEICNLPKLEAEGIFSHLACGDCRDSSSVHDQFRAFMFCVDKLSRAGRNFPLRHILNSAGIIDFPEYQLDMVRPGISLYGYYPSREVHTERVALKPVLSWKTRVMYLHQVQAGKGISYGWTYRAQQDSQVATLGVGYGDGYLRALSGQASVLAGGMKVPILGRICMDQCMIDGTMVHTIHAGDEITLIGKDGDAAITAEELGELAGTIPYEILCAVGRRVPRLYYKNGGLVEVLNRFSC